MIKQISKQKLKSKLVAKTFKITDTQATCLELEPFKKAPGILVRILLSDFFDGKLPIQRAAFLNAVKKFEYKNGENNGIKPRETNGGNSARSRSGN